MLTETHLRSAKHTPSVAALQAAHAPHVHAARLQARRDPCAAAIEWPRPWQLRAGQPARVEALQAPLCPHRTPMSSWAREP